VQALRSESQAPMVLADSMLINVLIGAITTMSLENAGIGYTSLPTGVTDATTPGAMQHLHIHDRRHTFGCNWRHANRRR